MKNTITKIASLSAALLLTAGIALYAKPSDAAPSQKVKSYDGIITQINLTDGSFVMRLRDGSIVTVASPLQVDAFVSVKGILDPAQKTLDKISEIKTKEKNGPDAIPAVSSIDPGSGQVGAKINVSGTGFTKKKNSISIGDVKDAIINLQSKDGKILVFNLPVSPCNQKIKTNCATSVLPAGSYNIVVSNENGVSNAMPFSVIPLPPLAITTDILPQITAGTRYNAAISAIGGAEGYSWRVSDGKLPPGLILARATCAETPCRTAGVVSGIPTSPGIHEFTVTLTSGQESISRQFVITVVQALNSPY